ncbi:MAG: nucleotidyltransferase family protein [Desulfovibrio sp.]|nr:nucleotidyltransferase family protein [Desulfovibrio sp.]MBI4959169.1 nucleotidyltransferase family protein [Desulfovibrio sp.]
MNMTDVTAIILAGGLGTRLRQAIPDRPKALAHVAGRPFLDYILDWLTDSGITQAVLCTGHMADMVQQHYGDRHGDLHLAYSREETPLGTGGALRLAAPLVRTDLALVLNGDSFVEADLREFADWFHERKARVGILAVAVQDASRFGRLVLDREGAVQAFLEKEPDAGPGDINSGVYLMERDVLSHLSPATPLSLEHDVFPALIGQGLYAYTAQGRFLDIGTPASYAEAQVFFSPGPQ